jgi:NADPH-dependent 2,4-dienoyl-CoA reductase/sulfur reductase-like enzyme
MTRRTELNCDVLVIGAGPAGIAACVSAAKSGAKAILVDDNPFPGGQIWRATTDEPAQHVSSSRDAALWLRRLRECGATLLSSTRVVARLSEELVLAENENEAIEITFHSAILATGARELVLPFPGWTLPNVFAAGGLQALVKSGFSVEGKRIVVAGTGPLLLAVAAFLKSKGARIQGVYEQSSWSQMIRFTASVLKRRNMLWSALGYGAGLRNSPLRCGWWPLSAEGDDCVGSITFTNGAKSKTVDCDLVACGFHLVPNTELPSAFGCMLDHGKVKVDEWQQTSADRVFTVGESTGIGGLELALVEGQIAGLAATGNKEQTSRLFNKRKALEKMARAMDRTFALRPELRYLPKPDTIVCRCEDVPWSALHHQRSMRAAKLHTRCGMGACQGRICGAALEFLSGWKSEFTRPPVYPVRLSTLIGDPQVPSKENP